MFLRAKFRTAPFRAGISDKLTQKTDTPSSDAKGTDSTNACQTVSCKVGATGFEPAISCSQSRRDTGLRYAPNFKCNLPRPPALAQHVVQPPSAACCARS